MNEFHLWDGFTQGVTLSLSYIVNPEKRIHYLYLLSSLLLAYYVYRKGKHGISFIRYIGNRNAWYSRSARVDYGLFFFNNLLKVLLLAPYLGFGLYIAFYCNEYLCRIWGFPEEHISQTTTLILYFLTLTIVGDFFTYLVHWAMHSIPFFWRFHKVHHSATTLNPMTQYRIHPVELLINNIKNILVFGFVTGLFDYLSAHQIQKETFIGTNVFTFLFLFWGANLRHSHVPLSYFHRLEKFFISPRQHQIHHSNNPLHYNKNMGAKLALWDWLFGTLIRSKQVANLNFGLGRKEGKFHTSFWQNLYTPFLQK